MRLVLALVLVLWGSPAWAAPAFDAASCDNVVGGVTGTITWDHTPVGTPRGVLVLVVQSDELDVSEGADQVTTVTYGGVSLTEVASGSPQAVVGGTENGVVHAFFLGASVPTGTREVSVAVSGASEKAACVVTVTAGANTAVDTSAGANNSASANPTVVLSTTASTETVVVGGAYTGPNSNTCCTPGADFTEIDEEDLGTDMALFQRRTTNGAGGSITVDWVMTSDEWAVIGVAIKESAASTTDCRNLLLFGVGGACS